ncbi:hypothetical protein, partial [Paenibacillus sp. FSL M7-0831]|uniref:hypothetical protein n=1 Tax=Paenibacillus sp. FSL M7-0831 TaxID=2975314 RepID=UPI0030FAB36A
MLREAELQMVGLRGPLGDNGNFGRYFAYFAPHQRNSDTFGTYFSPILEKYPSKLSLSKNNGKKITSVARTLTSIFSKTHIWI